MKQGIVYLKTRRRMPVRCIPLAYLRDTQQDIPVGWCAECRREIYRSETELCQRCEGVKEYAEE